MEDDRIRARWRPRIRTRLCGGGEGHVYEGGVRVPFTISGPGIQAGAVSQVPVCGVDLLPTITDFAGKQLKHANLDGGSLKSLLLGESEIVNRQNDFLVFHQAVTRHAESAIRSGDYKLVKMWAEDTIELFDLSKDLGELQDLSQKMPEKAEELRKKLEIYLDAVNATTEKMGTKAEIYKLWKD